MVDGIHSRGEENESTSILPVHVKPQFVIEIGPMPRLASTHQSISLKKLGDIEYWESLLDRPLCS